MSIKSNKVYIGNSKRLEIIECPVKIVTPTQNIKIKKQFNTGEDIIKKHYSNKYTKKQQEISQKFLMDSNEFKLTDFMTMENISPQINIISKFNSRNIKKDLNNNNYSSAMQIIQKKLDSDIDNNSRDSKILGKKTEKIVNKQIPSTMKTDTKPTIDQLKAERIDNRGIIIKKGSKIHKIAFIDKLEGKKPLTDIIKVTSYKQFNINKENKYLIDNKNENLNCCLIF